MPVPSVWVVIRRSRRVVVGVAGGFKGAEAVVKADAAALAAKAHIERGSLTVWQEHGEPAPHGKITRASLHVASRSHPGWTVTYDCQWLPVYQRPTPRRVKPVRAPEPEEVSR